MERYTFMSDSYYTISSEKCFEDQNEDYCGDAIDRLAYYENLIEEGRLIILSIEDINPCRSCKTGWGSISSNGYESCGETCVRLKEYNEKYNKKYI